MLTVAEQRGRLLEVKPGGFPGELDVCWRERAVVGDSGHSGSSWRLELLFAQMGKEAAGAGLAEGGDGAPEVGVAFEGSVRDPRGPEHRTSFRQHLKS